MTSYKPYQDITLLTEFQKKKIAIQVQVNQENRDVIIIRIMRFALELSDFLQQT